MRPRTESVTKQRLKEQLTIAFAEDLAMHHNARIDRNTIYDLVWEVPQKAYKFRGIKDDVNIALRVFDRVLGDDS